MDDSDFLSKLDTFRKEDIASFSAKDFETWLEIGFKDYPLKQRGSFGNHLRFLIHDQDDPVSALAIFHDRYLEDEQQKKKFKSGLAELLSRCPSQSLPAEVAIDLLTLSELIDAWEVADKLQSAVILEGNWNENKKLFQKVVDFYMRFASRQESVQKSLHRLITSSSAVEDHQLGTLLLAACISAPERMKEYILAKTFEPRFNAVLERADSIDDARSRMASPFVNRLGLKDVLTALLELLGKLNNHEYAGLGGELWLISGMFIGCKAPCKLIVEHGNGYKDYIIECQKRGEKIRVSDLQDSVDKRIWSVAFVRLFDILNKLPVNRDDWGMPSDPTSISQYSSLDIELLESISNETVH